MDFIKILLKKARFSAKNLVKYKEKIVYLYKFKEMMRHNLIKIIKLVKNITRGLYISQK